METYYETIQNDGSENPTTTTHETLEEAIAFADANGIDLICEIGGSWDEYRKCEWCGEWWDTYTLDQNDGICDYCYEAIRSRGERWRR